MKSTMAMLLVGAVGAAILGISAMRIPTVNVSVSAPPSAIPRAKDPATLNELLALPRKQIEACDVARLNLLCAEGLPGAENLNVSAGLSTLDQWARPVDSETRRHLYRFHRNPAEFERSEAKFRMLMLGVVLQSNLGIRYNPERIRPVGVFEPNHIFFADSRDVLLHGLIGERRMGTCSSLPVLYLAVGRRLGYPLKLVQTMTHLFVRWDSPAERFNVEATGRGVGWHDDAYYKKWPFPVSEDEVAALGLLKSMSPTEELAQFLSIRSACLMAAGRGEEAISCQEQALRLDPGSRIQQLTLAARQREWAERIQPKRAGPGLEEFLPPDIEFGRSPWGPVPSWPRPAWGPEIPDPRRLLLPQIPQVRIPNPYQQGGP